MPRRKSQFQQRNQKKVWSNSNCFENKFWFVFIIQCIMKVLLYPRFKEEGLFYLCPSFWPKHIFVKLFLATTHHSHLIFGMWLQSGILHCIYWIQTSRTSTSCLPTLAQKKYFVCLRLPDRPYFNSLPFNILFHLLKIKKIQRSPTNPFLIQSCCQMTVLIAVVERYASVWTNDTLN